MSRKKCGDKLNWIGSITQLTAFKTTSKVQEDMIFTIPLP